MNGKKLLREQGNFSEYMFLEAYDLASNENAIKASREEIKKL